MNKGIVKDKNMAAYYEWLLSIKFEHSTGIKKKILDIACKYHSEKGPRADCVISENEPIDHLFCLDGGWASYPYTETPEYKWPRHLQARVEEYKQLFQFAKTFSQDVQAEWYPEYAIIYIGNPEKGLLVLSPEEFLEFVPAPKFDDISPAQLKAQLALNGKGGNATDIVSAANFFGRTVLYVGNPVRQ